MLRGRSQIREFATRCCGLFSPRIRRRSRLELLLMLLLIIRAGSS